jgi:hypothetical protein
LFAHVTRESESPRILPQCGASTSRALSWCLLCHSGTKSGLGS